MRARAYQLRKLALFSVGLGLLGAAACSANDSGGNFHGGTAGASGAGTGGQGGAAGSIYIPPDDAGTPQEPGVPQTCEQALQQQSYLGCEYWPTVTSNSGLYYGFQFAIVAANPTDSSAWVRVERDGQLITEGGIEPGQLQAVTLPWVDNLKQVMQNDGSGLVSIISRRGAYHVTSSVPITLYQFNPLEFQLPSTPFDCPNLEVGGCFSFTNDASLLLPTSALRNEYYAMNYPTHHVGFSSGSDELWVDSPGFIAITATQDDTEVTFSTSGYVRSGPEVQAMSPGESRTFTLNAGDVLMLDSGTMPARETPEPGKPCVQVDQGLGTAALCPSPKEYDLTGSHIVSTKPISVLGGHDCSMVPYDRFACDHLEESLFPVETLGKDLIVTAPQAVAAIEAQPGAPDNMYVRVLSATDNNQITFDPPVHDPVTLNAGQWLEIGPINQDVRVSAVNKIMVSQFMVGENFNGDSVGAGDPSQSVAIPTEQYRLEYTFLAPVTYTYNYVNVVAPIGSQITIDDQTIPAEEFQPIGSSGMAVARHRITGGAHNMKGDHNFGIVVYGYGSYTSYMYPGGLNLETIVINPA